MAALSAASLLAFSRSSALLQRRSAPRPLKAEGGCWPRSRRLSAAAAPAGSGAEGAQRLKVTASAVSSSSSSVGDPTSPRVLLVGNRKLVQSQQDLRDAFAYFVRERPSLVSIGFTTCIAASGFNEEGAGTSMRRPGATSLLQVALPGDGGVYLFDLLSPTASPGGGAPASQQQLSPLAAGSPLRALLEDPATEKLVFGCRHVADALLQQFGVRVAGVLDLQVELMAARLLNGRCGGRRHTAEPAAPAAAAPAAGSVSSLAEAMDEAMLQDLAEELRALEARVFSLAHEEQTRHSPSTPPARPPPRSSAAARAGPDPALAASPSSAAGGGAWWARRPLHPDAELLAAASVAALFRLHEALEVCLHRDDALEGGLSAAEWRRRVVAVSQARAAAPAARGGSA